jgi:hypothetical protein
VRALTGGAGLGPRGSERPQARERICVAGLTRRGAPRAWTHVTPGHTVRATWRTWIWRRAGRGLGPVFVCCGGVPVCPGLARGPAARENRSGRSARFSLPMRSTPMSRAVGIPHEVDRTAQDQDLFLQYRGIRYGLLHSVTRCSVGGQNAAAALRFRQDDNGIGGQAKPLAMAQLRHRRECGRLQNSEGWGPFSQDEYVAPEVSWRLEYSGRPARLRRTVCASGSPHPHPAAAQSPYSLTPQRPYLASLLRDLVRRLRVELSAGAG